MRPDGAGWSRVARRRDAGGRGARRRDARCRAAGIAVGYLLDRAFGDPARLHPVAGFGRLALAAERRLLDPTPSPNRQRLAGLIFAAGLVGGATATTEVIGRLASRSTAATVAWNAAVVWACLGGTSLLSVAERHAELLERNDDPGARELLPWLCGRDPAGLDRAGLARAVIESVAENTADAAVGTLFWAAVAGPPGAVAHRAANTLDAMVGHRSSRYLHFGCPAARLDDVVGFLPARAAGVAGVACAPTVGGSARGALRVWRRDARAHPSPNAGVVEAVCAGALGVRLGGRTAYAYGVQERAVLGDGREVCVGDIRRAIRLHERVQVVTALLAAGVVAGTGGWGGWAWRVGLAVPAGGPRHRWSGSGLGGRAQA